MCLFMVCVVVLASRYSTPKSLFYLISRSMLHRGDMSSNVLENFTTYRKYINQHNQQYVETKKRILHEKSYMV